MASDHLQCFREAGLLEQYVRGADEDEDEASSMDSVDGTTASERSASVITNSSAETFFSLDEEDQVRLHFSIPE